MNISREYHLINKTTNGEIITVRQGRKGLQIYVLLKNQESSMETYKQNAYSDLSEVELDYEVAFDWTKYDGGAILYNFLDDYLFQEGTKYGSGKSNRAKENLKK